MLISEITQIVALAVLALVRQAHGACSFGPPIAGVDVTDTGAYTEAVAGIAASKTVAYSTMVSTRPVPQHPEQTSGDCAALCLADAACTGYAAVSPSSSTCFLVRTPLPAGGAVLPLLASSPYAFRQKLCDNGESLHVQSVHPAAVVPAATQTCAYALRSATAAHPTGAVADLSADKMICENQCKMSESTVIGVVLGISLQSRPTASRSA